MKTVQKVKLVYEDWALNSNKEYNVEIIDNGIGYTVECTYGRRYNANSKAVKTQSPVPYESALKVFNKTVSQKIVKGYKIISSNGVEYI